MSSDLEATLQELGPEYRAVVDRVQSAYRPWKPFKDGMLVLSAPQRHFGRIVGWTAGYLIAASLLVTLTLSVVFRDTTPVNEFTLAHQGGFSAIREMIRTQNPDGSWKTDYLTRQNAAALRLCKNAEAQVAFKKAVRNLRTRGLY